MSTDVWTITVTALAVAIGGFSILRLVRVWTVTPPDDLTRIHAHLEGLVGEAGPNKRVVDIVHNGGTLGSRYEPPKRRYIVTLQGPDGATEQRTVFIAVGLLGSGAMTVLPHGRWR